MVCIAPVRKIGALSARGFDQLLMMRQAVRNSSIPFATRVVALLCAGLLGGRLAHAQEPASAEHRERYFTLDQIDAYLELESQFDQTRVRNDGRGRFGGDRRQTNRDWRI